MGIDSKLLSMLVFLQEVLTIIPLPHKPTQIGVVGSEKGCIIDIKTKRNVRSIPKWNGSCTRDGKFGLYAPSRGGLELLELRKGSTGEFFHKYSPIYQLINILYVFIYLFNSQNIHSESG